MSVIIVGAGPGLGAALAMRFGRDGERVAVISRTTASTKQLVSDAQRSGLKMRAFTANAGSQASLAKGLSAATEWTGTPNVLVYNAASFNEESGETLGVDALQKDLAVNLIGAVQSVQAVLPKMLARNSGTILLTGGGLAVNPVANWTSLAVGKAALRAYAHSLHKAMANRGVHVATVTICGVIETGGLFDPHRIADAYWNLHTEPRGSFTPELLYQPEGADLNYNES